MNFCEEHGEFGRNASGEGIFFRRVFAGASRRSHHVDCQFPRHASVMGGRAGSPLPPAFTLVELLVVIAVIAILAALLLPVLSRTKLKAMQTQCLSNLKQMALAHTMYLSDYHETCFPYDTTTGNNLLWMGRLIDYQARVDTVRICPAASDTNAPDRFGTADKAWHHDSKSPVKRWYGSYSLNGWLYSNLTNRNGAMPSKDQDKVFKKETEVLMPSQTPVFSDSI